MNLLIRSLESGGLRVPFRRLRTITSLCANQQKEGDPLACWSCQSPFDCSAFFCSACGTLQPIVQNDGSYNYYAIFGINPSFDLNTQQLSTHLKDLQRILHPDKYGRKSDTEKQFSQQCSTVVNEAYATLADPIRRALHLLQLNNVKVDEKSFREGKLGQNFLLEIMDLNEELEEIDSVESLEKFDAKVSAEMNKLFKELSQHFAKKNFEAAKSTLAHARYFNNLKEKMKEMKVRFVTANH